MALVIGDYVQYIKEAYLVFIEKHFVSKLGHICGLKLKISHSTNKIHIRFSMRPPPDYPGKER